MYLIWIGAWFGVDWVMEVLERPTTNRVTLRLQNDTLDTLKREASKTHLTLNAIINKILNKNIANDENVNAILNVVFPHDFFLLIVDKLNERDIKDLAQKGPGVVRKMFSVIGMPYDVDHVVHNYFAVMGKYCKWFEFSHKRARDRYRLVFSADSATEKWVTFVRIYIRTILESLKVAITSESQQDGIIVFEFGYKEP